MRDLADVFKALAEETRLEILALLANHGELCVCDLQEVLGIIQSKTSRHLQYLKHAGLLTDRRAGLWVHYRIAAGLDPERKAIVAVLRRLLANGAGGGAREALRALVASARPVKARRASHSVPKARAAKEARR